MITPQFFAIPIAVALAFVVTPRACDQPSQRETGHFVGPMCVEPLAPAEPAWCYPDTCRWGPWACQEREADGWAGDCDDCGWEDFCHTWDENCGWSLSETFSWGKKGR